MNLLLIQFAISQLSLFPSDRLLQLLQRRWSLGSTTREGSSLLPSLFSARIDPEAAKIEFMRRCLCLTKIPSFMVINRQIFFHQSIQQLALFNDEKQEAMDLHEQKRQQCNFYGESQKLQQLLQKKNQQNIVFTQRTIQWLYNKVISQMDKEQTQQKKPAQLIQNLKGSQLEAALPANAPIYKFTLQKLPNVIAKKVSSLVSILNTQVINLKRLKQCVFEGIPEEAKVLKQYCWKLVLGYLPPQKQKWQYVIDKQEKTYESLVDMFLPPSKFEDHPLILKKGHQKFQQLQEDYLLWQQIQKDTSRTHAQLSFFSTETKQIMIPYLTSARREKFKMINGDNQLGYRQFLQNKQKQRKTYRYDYMTRILYIYARLNPKIQYVQGMNEILAPIFYLVNINKPTTMIEEASCFFMFNNAISDIIELHIKDLDRSQNGIYGKLNQVNEILVVIEPMIWSRLQKLKIDPFFYCFRWVTLLYTQDFALFDILRIWEGIFSAEDRLKFINFVAIAMIISCKEVIVKQEFTVVLEHMQDIKNHVNVNDIVKTAGQLYYQFKDKEFSQHAKKTKHALVKMKDRKDQNDDQDSEEDKEKQKGGFFNKISLFVNGYF